MATKNFTLTQERLKEFLRYDRETGVFIWIARPLRSTVHIGDIAGHLNAEGYVRIMFKGTLFPAHRLAWLYITGEFPSEDIDHYNGIRNDNRFENFRLVKKYINSQNQHRAHSNNKTGFLGVSFHKGKFRAQIKYSGKIKHIGMFDAPEDAHKAYLEVKRKVHIGCTI